MIEDSKRGQEEDLGGLVELDESSHGEVLSERSKKEIEIEKWRKSDHGWNGMQVGLNPKK